MKAVDSIAIQSDCSSLPQIAANISGAGLVMESFSNTPHFLRKENVNFWKISNMLWLARYSQPYILFLICALYWILAFSTFPNIL